MKGEGRSGCYDKAVELLARRPHFAVELSKKLAARGYASEEVEEAVARLVAQGYLHDGATAETYVAQRQAKGPEGARRLAAELARRGAGSDEVRRALEAISPEDELEAARRAAEQWRRKGGKDPAALARHLDRKGFTRSLIYRLLGEDE